MTKPLSADTIESLWPGDGPAPRPPSLVGVGERPGFRPPRSRSELRADETTRVAREIMDAEAEKRRANLARLDKARREREAEQAALAAVAPPKPKPKTRRRG